MNNIDFSTIDDSDLVIKKVGDKYVAYFYGDRNNPDFFYGTSTYNQAQAITSLGIASYGFMTQRKNRQDVQFKRLSQEIRAKHNIPNFIWFWDTKSKSKLNVERNVISSILKSLNSKKKYSSLEELTTEAINLYRST